MAMQTILRRDIGVRWSWIFSEMIVHDVFGLTAHRLLHSLTFGVVAMTHRDILGGTFFVRHAGAMLTRAASLERRLDLGVCGRGRSAGRPVAALCGLCRNEAK
jgi:hypothetical protein